MAQNLNYGTRVNGTLSTDNQSNDDLIEKYCYGDLDANCATDGGLYQWAEAMGFPSACNFQLFTACGAAISTPNHQGICPTGWHIPKTAEWNTLENALGSATAGNQMKATTGWNTSSGTNSSGFSGLPAGSRLYRGGFLDRGIYAYFWEAKEDNASLANYRYLNENVANMFAFSNNKTLGLSVRCVKDN
jgi:uncharacterized protein (TIGR02145 family)